MSGKVVDILLSPARGAALQSWPQAEAVAGFGLMGDRFFGDRKSEGRELTLVAVEDVAHAAAATAASDGQVWQPKDTRRNVVVEGVDLNSLVGQTFHIGDVECVGVEPCEPCSLLAKRTSHHFMRALVHRGGLRAKIIQGGVVRVGDSVVVA